MYNNPTSIQWILNLNIKQLTKVLFYIRGFHSGINASESKLEGEQVKTKTPMSGLGLEEW